MSKIKAGTKVPDFSLPMTGGGTWKLKDAAGRKLVIYFYPRDMTSGCTRESQNCRDLTAAFRKAGTDIVGISRDSVASHEKFAAREALPFPLLADTDEQVCKLFDVIQGEKPLRQKVPRGGAQHFSAGWRRTAAAGVAQGKGSRSRGGSP